MSQLDSIFQKPGGTAIDPICEMEVDMADPPGGTAEHEGQTYYFCGPGCREEFQREPTKYL